MLVIGIMVGVAVTIWHPKSNVTNSECLPPGYWIARVTSDIGVSGYGYVMPRKGSFVGIIFDITDTSRGAALTNAWRSYYRKYGTN